MMLPVSPTLSPKYHGSSYYILPAMSANLVASACLGRSISLDEMGDRLVPKFSSYVLLILSFLLDKFSLGSLLDCLLLEGSQVTSRLDWFSSEDPAIA